MIFCILFYSITTFGPHKPLEVMQLDLRSSQVLLRGCHLPVSLKANTYQYPLQSQHLPVYFAELTPTNIYCKAIIY